MHTTAAHQHSTANTYHRIRTNAAHLTPLSLTASMTESTRFRRARTFAFRVRDNFHGVFLQMTLSERMGIHGERRHVPQKTDETRLCWSECPEHIVTAVDGGGRWSVEIQAIGKGRILMTKQPEKWAPTRERSDEVTVRLAPGFTQASPFSSSTFF